MDPSDYKRADIERALERRGVKDHHIPFWAEDNLTKYLDRLRNAIRAQKIEEEAERKRVNALPRSALRRRPLPYEIVKHISSFVVGPRAISVHVALSRLSWSVRTYLFGQNDRRIEKSWKQLCLHSGLGQHREDVTDIDSGNLSWEETATTIADNKWGFGYEGLLVSWSQMETSYRWTRWNRLLLHSSSSTIKVLSKEQVKKQKVKLQINPGLSTVRLMGFNEVDVALKTVQGYWWGECDWPHVTSLLLTWPPVSSLDVIMKDVSGQYHTFHLWNEEGVVIWDIFRKWWDEMWFPVETDLLQQFVEGDRGDYSAAIPTNEDGELYEYVDESDEDEVDSDDDDGATWAEKREAALNRIIESEGGTYGLMYGRVLFGKQLFLGKTSTPTAGSTTLELIFEY